MTKCYLYQQDYVVLSVVNVKFLGGKELKTLKKCFVFF